MRSLRLSLSLAMLVGVLLAVSLGCGASKDGVLVLRVRHGAPESMPMHRALLHVASLVEERSGGRIRLTVEAGLLLPKQIEEIAGGSGEISMSGMGGLADYYRPLAALEAPYLFRDVDHFYRTVETPFWRTLVSEVERRSGLHVIDMWHQGVRQVTLRDRNASTPEDFGEITLRVPPSRMYVECARVLGALPTTMSINDVRMAIRAGTVDGQENPLPTIRAMGFQDVCSYLILTNHSITPIMPIINRTVWSSISEQDRELIETAFHDGGSFNRQIVEEEERRLIGEFERSGMTVVRPDPRVFRARAERVWRRYSGVWGDSLVAQIQSVR